MLKYQLRSLCRSIVRGWGMVGGPGRRYRSIRASAVLASTHVLIHSHHPLSSAVVRLCCCCLAVARRTFSMMAAAGSNSNDDAGIVLKLVAASVCIADRAGGVVRNVMSAGNLGIVEKVWCCCYGPGHVYFCRHHYAIMQTFDFNCSGTVSLKPCSNMCMCFMVQKWTFLMLALAWTFLIIICMKLLVSIFRTAQCLINLFE